MILLSKKQDDGTYFEFDKILIDGYRIDEKPKEKIIQYSNGNRKKIKSEYVDVKIEIDLGCFDGDTLANYLKQLTDGEYKYYSLNDKTMKSMNLLVTLPVQEVNSCATQVIVNDFTVTLERSSDV